MGQAASKPEVSWLDVEWCVCKWGRRYSAPAKCCHLQMWTYRDQISFQEKAEIRIFRKKILTFKQGYN